MKTPSAVPHQYSIMHEIIRLIRIICLIIYMDRSYSDYIDIIDEVENIEQVIKTDNRIRINEIRNTIYQQ